MPRGVRKPLIDESKLSKGDKRSLLAIRKKLGQKIADKAFAEYLASANGESDYAPLHATLWPLVKSKKVKIPRGGLLIRRGRGRLVFSSGK